MSKIFTFILLLLAIAGIIISIWQIISVRSTVFQINKILDSAISGNFSVKTFNETIPSMLEQKLYRFVSSNNLAKQKAQEDKELTTRLISDISHQTKTPITNIVMYSELLQEEPEISMQLKNMTQSIYENASKLDFLIQSLVKTARLEHGILQMHPEHTLFNELIHHSLLSLYPQATAKNIKIKCTVNNEYIYADAKWTGEALYNIIDNAIKYTPYGGIVSISYLNYESFSKIDIADNGPGIPEEFHSNIFSRFWRAPEFAKEEGLGIGLFTARQIIHEQGGYIRLNSKPNAGSVFSVFLPKEKRI